MSETETGQARGGDARRRYVRSRPVAPPSVPLSRLPVSAILSHLAWTRRTLKGSALRRREAGGDGFLREWEARLVRELDSRQLRLT